MKLRQLHYFVTIAECGSYTKAAARLFTAQPSLSQQIRALETTLGARLFDRVPTGVILSPAGAALLPEARIVLAAADRARAVVRAAQSGVELDLEVLAVRSVASNVLPAVLGAWHAVNPDTVINLRDYQHRTMIQDAMSRGKGDIAIGPRPDDWKGPVESIGFEEMVLVARNLADISDARNDPASLSSKEWVLFDPAHGLAEVIDIFCAAYAIQQRPAARCAQVDTALSLCLDGVGITLLPQNVVPEALRADHTMAVGGGFFRELVAYTRQGRTGPVERFVKLLLRAELPLRTSVDSPTALLC